MARPLSNGRKNQLTVDGDSMVDGLSALGPTQTLPALMAKLLGNKWNVSDVSHAGDSIAVLIAGIPAVTASYDTHARRNELVAWAGTNDGGNEGDTFAVAAGEMQDYFTTVAATGWRLTFIACLPRAINLGTWNPDEVTFRTGYNGMMQTWCAAHGVRYLDPGTDSRLSDPANRTYFDDGLHLTPAGEQIVADQLYALLK